MVARRTKGISKRPKYPHKSRGYLSFYRRPTCEHIDDIFFTEEEKRDIHVIHQQLEALKNPLTIQQEGIDGIMERNLWGNEEPN